MKKRLHNSRQGRALLYALLLAAVILVSSETGFYYFLPQQALLEKAEQQGIETLEPVMWLQGENPTGTGPARLTLSVGERTLFFCPVKFYLWGGWRTGAWGIVETWEGEGPYFGVWQHAKTNTTYVFGQVDDPAVKALIVHAKADQWDDLEPGDYAGLAGPKRSALLYHGIEKCASGLGVFRHRGGWKYRRD